MKIAIYSTMVIPTNPNLNEYGGLELVAGLQAKYFDEQGHDVSLFACQGSYFSKEDHEQKLCSDRSHLYAVGSKGTNPVDAWKTYWDTPETRKILKEADIVVDHSWQWYPYARYEELKNICKIEHGPNPSFRKKPPWEKLNMIAVSFNHAKQLMRMAPGLTWRAVQNGIPLWKYKFNNKPIAERERLLWLSRIYEPKGAHRAIEIANNLQMPIDIVGGSFGDTLIKPYCEKVKKMCDESKFATFHGEVSFDKKLEFYRNAKCVVMPIMETGFEFCTPQHSYPSGWEWHEPFGLITPEANACGTPVMISPNTGWNESMVHGFNGYFANTNKEFEYFINRIDELKPENCRYMAERFDYSVMGENYLNLFKEIIEGRGW